MVAKSSEAKAAQEILNRLKGLKKGSKAVLLRPDVEGTIEPPLEVPTRAFDLLIELFAQLAEGNDVAVLPSSEEISTQQAADLLNVSRPYLIKVLENKEIPHRKVGNRRRLKVSDVKAYKEEQEKSSEHAMKDLMDQAQELDMGY